MIEQDAMALLHASPPEMFAGCACECGADDPSTAFTFAGAIRYAAAKRSRVKSLDEKARGGMNVL